MSPFPHVRREQVPITDPRWLASTQPDPEPEVDEPVHWRTGTHPNHRLACGVESGRSNAAASQVTCEACQSTVVRSLCLKPTPGDILGLEVVCRRVVGPDGLHDGPCDWEKPLSSPLTDHERIQALAGNPPPSDFTQREMEDFSGYVAYAAEAELRDTPSDVLPRRVPGEALREAQEAALSEFESEGGTSGPGDSARPLANAFPRPLLGRWVC